MCGCRASSNTFIESRRMFRNLQYIRYRWYSVNVETKCGPTDWSTDFKTPVIERSFFSSTVTVRSVSVLKTENMSFALFSHVLASESNNFTIAMGQQEMQEPAVSIVQSQVRVSQNSNSQTLSCSLQNIKQDCTYNTPSPCLPNSNPTTHGLAFHSCRRNHR